MINNIINHIREEIRKNRRGKKKTRGDRKRKEKTEGNKR